MREILFKAKCEGDGKWVYGSLHIEFGEMNKDRTCSIDYTILGMRGECYYIDPETLCQYTECTDNKDVKIFEKDIVDFFGMHGKIVYEYGSFGIDIPNGINYDLLKRKIPFKNSADLCFNDNFISLYEIFWNYGQNNIEVIGNIHDNIELMNSEKQE